MRGSLPLRRVSARRLLILWAALLALAGGVRATPADTTRNPVLGIIDTIIVGGNEKTQAYVILDEMT
ncbi:MAG TPA: hypothetical protein VMM80_06410, partial [Bacteroidota bacterium]|nr:hypothetical protein [Bacteroidota bacterium]